MTELSIPEQCALASEIFPREWAGADALWGESRRKKRHALRKRAVYALRLRPLQAAGASCGTCKHFSSVPMSKTKCCDLESDFHGYAVTTADRLCADYSGPKMAKPNPTEGDQYDQSHG